MARAFCVEIGGTRIKWAFVDHVKGNVADWSGPSVRTMRSLGWLNGTLPQLFSHDWPGLADREPAMKDVDDICVAVCSPVENRRVGGQLRRKGAPERLWSIIESQWPGKYVKLVNDARACFEGFRRWDRGAAGPFLILTFGTGVGIVAADSSGRILSSEFVHPFVTEELSRASGRTAVDVHEALGRGFFDWAGSSCAQWSYRDVRSQYTARVAGLVTDCASAWGTPSTLVIAGGNAEYVSIRELQNRVLHMRIVPLRRPELGAVDPDLISLVGAL